MVEKITSSWGFDDNGYVVAITVSHSSGADGIESGGGLLSQRKNENDGGGDGY